MPTVALVWELDLMWIYITPFPEYARSYHLGGGGRGEMEGLGSEPGVSQGFSSVQSFSHVRLFVTPWITARQASLSITNSRSSLKLMSIKSMMPRLTFCLMAVTTLLRMGLGPKLLEKKAWELGSSWLHVFYFQSTDTLALEERSTGTRKANASSHCESGDQFDMATVRDTCAACVRTNSGCTPYPVICFIRSEQNGAQK